MALHALHRMRRVVIVFLVLLVAVPVLWYVNFGIGHGSGHSGTTPITGSPGSRACEEMRRSSHVLA